MAKPPSRLSRLKSWPGWLLLAVVVAAALAVGVARSGGTRSSQERIDEISQQLACPICNGQSVYESENPTSQAIRTEIGRLVREGQLNDDQILMRLEQSYSGSMLRP
ncbi:MAG TPA: cytochrome c-type biogenesis protein CcmH, partial [Ilumatobacteraceae bacterium]|nr:cytochrome c-type biogenesis protein CcmH [Ilumatobacteraceae bacterium]